MSSLTTDGPTQNRALLGRLITALNSADSELIATTIDRFFDPDAAIRTALKVDATGTDLMKRIWGALLDGFPDLHVEVEDVIAEGDKVVARNTVSGTHRGEYLGVPPTHRVITWNEIFVARVADGRIVETWGVVDMAAQMRQLGVIPTPG